jgi:hypothetical protein
LHCSNIWLTVKFNSTAQLVSSAVLLSGHSHSGDVWPVATAGRLKNNLGANKGVVNSGGIQKEGSMHILPKFGSCDNIFLFYLKIIFWSRYSLPLFLMV